MTEADPVCITIGELDRNGALALVVTDAVTDAVAGLIGNGGPLQPRNAAAMLTPEALRLIAARVRDFVAGAFGASRDPAQDPKGGGVRAARLHAMKADIAGNLERSGFTIGELAARHRVSRRYVQMLFEAEGTKFTEFLRNQRLTRAHAMLSDQRFDDRSIASVAFDVGFGDLSYFNRQFKRRFACSPSELRKAARRADRARSPLAAENGERADG